MSQTMRAMRLTALDGPSALALADVPAPPAGERLLIEVYAAGVGFPDLLMTRGQYQLRPDPPFTPGVEIAGIVQHAPPGSGFTEGDRVAASSLLGGWAEIAPASPLVTFPIPDGMSFAMATALVNYQTVHFALAERGHARAGEVALVHGAGGGVGSAAVDIASALGMMVIALGRGERKQAAAREAGAAHCIDPDDAWLQEVRRVTDGRGVDVVFDPVGGDRFTNSLRALAPGGRALVVGFAAGTIPEVKVNRLLLNNTSVAGVAWAEYIRHDPSMPRRTAEALDALWGAGRIRPLVGAVYPLERAADALKAIEAREAIGKIVLRVRGDREVQNP